MNPIFWGLKDNWWKQVYDGKYHQHGYEVFDKGLHEGPKEPGFYNSIKLACEYTSEQLGTPLTIDHYKRIHQLACGHFSELGRNVVNVEKEKIDHFRDSECSCFRSLLQHIYEPEDPFQTKIRRVHFSFLHSIRWSLLTEDKIQTETGSKIELATLPNASKLRIIDAFSKVFNKYDLDVREFLEKGNPFYEEAIESTSEVNAQLKRVQEKLGLSKPFASFKIYAAGEETKVCARYLYHDPSEIEGILHTLIDGYNEQMESLPNKTAERSNEENKLALTFIAELFQNLEWLHPFFDGQGRTDLVLLSKLLTENGFNPAILYEPYLSTFEPLEKWISYLENGIDTWKKELEKDI